jgi:hypothetical protein
MWWSSLGCGSCGGRRHDLVQVALQLGVCGGQLGHLQVFKSQGGAGGRAGSVCGGWGDLRGQGACRGDGTRWKMVMECSPTLRLSVAIDG